jgi:thiosulfate/3-mercaptopyruvate sulfurtransferase
MNFTTLVDTATLAAHLDEPDWLIVDVRHQLADTAYGERVYAAGHIPGAHFLHCDCDLSGAMNGTNGRHPLPSADKLAARLGEIGIDSKTQVVVYDDAQGMIAGRLWWLLRWMGHDQVAVLDGGLQAWLAIGGALTQDLPVPRAANFVANVRDSLVDANYVQNFLATSRIFLVDARSPDRYRGENESIDPIGGRVPGAVNRFFRENLQENGCFKPAEQLRTEWLAALAGRSAEQVVHYCGSGVSACHNVLAMEVAGLLGSRLYAGSWSEWCSLPSRPMAQG